MIPRSDDRQGSSLEGHPGRDGATGAEDISAVLEEIERVYASLYEELSGSPAAGQQPLSASPSTDAPAALASHLERIRQLRAQVREHTSLRGALATTFDWLAFGFVVVDEEARVLVANQRARELLAPGDDIRESDGRIVGSRPEITRQIRAGIEAAIAREQHAARLLMVEREATRPLELTIDPLGDSTPGGRARLATISIADPEAPVRIPPQWLRDLYGLTPREAEVASLLAEGRRLGNIAEVLGVSVNTVKVRLQAVFDKTNTHRQAELARLLIDLAARIPPAKS